MERDKIKWENPDYKNRWGRVSDKEIDKMCLEGSHGSGDIIINRNQEGRTITFDVFRLEKVGVQITGIDTLSRRRAIEELKKLTQKTSSEEESNG